MSTQDLAERLADALAGVVPDATVTDLRRLSGGASRETWRFTCGTDDLVLQRTRPGAPSTGAPEAALLHAAGAAGVPVAEVLVAGDDPDGLGTAYMIVRAVSGETIARKIQRDDEFSRARSVLVGDMGRSLARLHSIPVAAVPGLKPEEPVSRYMAIMDALGDPHPAFELAFKWLEANKPDVRDDAVVHGDFRLGNLIVDGGGLRAVIDWELAHVGDPLEDLGWLCVRAWRFGGDAPVAGLGTREELFDAYESVAGTRPDADTVFWWEVFGTLRWGIICIMQASAHRSGMTRSHELAAIGRRVCENEYDVMQMLAGRW